MDPLQEYDLSDPQASFEKVGRMVLKEMVNELPGLYELPSKEVRGLRKRMGGWEGRLQMAKKATLFPSDDLNPIFPVDLRRGCSDFPWVFDGMKIITSYANVKFRARGL